MPPYADLEIHIQKREPAGYPIEITLNHNRHWHSTLAPDLPVEGDDTPLGCALFNWLFADVGLKEAWVSARERHPQRRVRLRFDDDAPELRALRWEALRDPASDVDVGASDATPLSRYLALSGHPGSPVLQKPLRILVAIAAPDNLNEYGLAPLNADAEWGALNDLAVGVNLVRLPGTCTLDAIEKALREGYHALHLIAHGRSRRGKGTLFLSGEHNQVAFVPDRDVIAMLKRQCAEGGTGQDTRLRMVFLSSCQSAPRAISDVLQGLAPALVRAGIPAVVAMQDTIGIPAARAFSSAFYQQVLAHGLVDLAANQARAALMTQKSPDAAVPVLFMRLPEGRLFAQERDYPVSGGIPLYTRVPDPRAPRLVGRDADLAWLCARLKRGDVSALAGVRGLGGIGKTEVAIAAAHALDGYFGGRVLWLDCGPNDVLSIQERMAAALGVKLEGDDLMQRADVLARAWRGQSPTLVVLDDVRAAHLQDFAALLPPRPPCALLLTSRRHDLPSLPPGALRHLKVLDPAPSQTLITDLLSVDLEPDPQTAGEIVELLDRVPLALTLAARRLARLAERRRAPDAETPWRVLLRELQERRAQVLHQGDRPDLSVWVAFGAGYDDLVDTDKKRLCRLGVFARSEFSLPALLTVWGDEESVARDALARLANAGLLEEVDDDVWWMHDLLREYAAVQLEQGDTDEVQAAWLAHAAYWRAYVTGQERREVEDWKILEVCRPEIERAADWLLPDRALLNPWLSAALAFAIDQKFQIYAFPHGETWLRAGLSAAQHLLNDPPPDMERETCQRWLAVTQSSLADLLRTRGQYEEAERLYRESLAVFEAVGDRRSVAVTQSSLADLLRTRGQYEEAE